MFSAGGSAAAANGPPRRLSALLCLDGLIAVLAVSDMACGIWHEMQEGGKPAAGPAAAGFACGTCATVYFGALCLCWDEGPSLRHLLLLATSFIALVSSVLLFWQLDSLEAPRVAATSAFVAFAALRLCPYEMSSAPPADTEQQQQQQPPPPQAVPAPPRLALQLETAAAVEEDEDEVTREEVLAEIRRIYRKVAPDKAQSAVELLERYPPAKWIQLLSLIRHKYGEDIETAVLAVRMASRSNAGSAAEQVAAAARLPAPSAGGRSAGGLGRAAALFLPVCAIVLADRRFAATDSALLYGLRTVSALTGPHYGSTMADDTTAQLRSLYSHLPTPAAISRPSSEWLEIPGVPSGVKHMAHTAVSASVRVRILTPSLDSSRARRLLQAMDGDADGGVDPPELNGWSDSAAAKHEVEAATAATPKRWPLLIWFSWSTLVLGGASAMDTGAGIAEALADSLDAVVAVVDVGLAPEHPYPYMTNAGLEAAVWLQQMARKDGSIGRAKVRVDPERISIGGAGAGGAIAAAVAISADRKSSSSWRTDPLTFESCVLITPMLECPSIAATEFQRSGSKGDADRDGTTVMSSSQVSTTHTRARGLHFDVAHLPRCHGAMADPGCACACSLAGRSSGAGACMQVGTPGGWQVAR